MKRRRGLSIQTVVVVLCKIPPPRRRRRQRRRGGANAWEKKSQTIHIVIQYAFDVQRPLYCDYHLLTVGQLEKKSIYNKIYIYVQYYGNRRREHGKGVGKRKSKPVRGCWGMTATAASGSLPAVVSSPGRAAVAVDDAQTKMNPSPGPLAFTASGRLDVWDDGIRIAAWRLYHHHHHLVHSAAAVVIVTNTAAIPHYYTISRTTTGAPSTATRQTRRRQQLRARLLLFEFARDR